MKVQPVHKDKDEQLYIDSIGMHSPQTKKIPRLELLKKYFNATLMRTKWDDRSKFETLSAIQRAIFEESKK